MKKSIFLFCVLLSSCFSSMAQTKEEIAKVYPEHQLIKVISYNIWNGFEGLKDVDRMKRVGAWLKKQAPDVVALQELCSFKEEDLLNFARSYGHTHVLLQKENGYPIGVTSKHPIEKVKVYMGKDMGHGFIHVRTFGMNMIVLHLSPSSWEKRLSEAKIVTDYMENKNLTRCLVMGDFNSHSPFDAEVLEKHTDLIRGWAAYGERYKENTWMHGKSLDFSVQSKFLSYPLEDAIRVFVPADRRMSYPAFTFSKYYKGRTVLEQSGERVDYILSTFDLFDEIIDAHVWNGEETVYFSDHYPVGIDLLINRKELE